MSELWRKLRHACYIAPYLDSYLCWFSTHITVICFAIQYLLPDFCCDKSIYIHPDVVFSTKYAYFSEDKSVIHLIKLTSYIDESYSIFDT